MKMKKLVVPMLSLTLMIPALAGAEAAPAATMMKASVNTPAAELRAGLDYLLSEHFTLAVTAMTKAYDGTKDAAAATRRLIRTRSICSPPLLHCTAMQVQQSLNGFSAHIISTPTIW